MIKSFSQPTFAWLSSPVTLISLLEAVDIHICQYADFALQRSSTLPSLTVSY
jgi:hypothetical protein